MKFLLSHSLSLDTDLGVTRLKSPRRRKCSSKDSTPKGLAIETTCVTVAKSLVDETSDEV